VNIKTVDWDSNDVGQQNLVVTFYKRDWYNVQEQTNGGPVWTVTFSDTTVATQTVTTDAKGVALASFTPEDGGTYRVVATGKDGKGNQVRSGTYLWVTSSEYVSWRQENNDRIQLVADKRSYAPGETASILIPSPFQGNVTALVTVERGRILSKQVITLKSNSELLKIPVTADMAPNAYVSVVLVKGVDKTTPIAAFKVGYASFAVSTVQQELKVSITTDRDPKTSHYAPRDTVTYTLQATDYSGKPVQAELSLAVADLSVLSLVDPNAPSIVNGFYGTRGLGIRTASTLVLSVDRLNVKLQTEIKGGGGGGEAAGEFAPRQQFFDTAYGARQRAPMRRQGAKCRSCCRTTHHVAHDGKAVIQHARRQHAGYYQHQRPADPSRHAALFVVGDSPPSPPSSTTTPTKRSTWRCSSKVRASPSPTQPRTA
jgi:uncharacterized protein YfaS (alpha-2-macroglobulin family)